ncbi:MAG: hypothetical protein J5737_05965 [Bacteroidales bacterium]|nr:hypothetical protein [Bacteroidales bacterium]
MHRFLIPACLLFLITACKVNEPGHDMPKATFTATQEYASDSKTSLGEGQVFWSADDAISIFSSSTPGGERYAISPECAGQTQAQFTGNDVGSSPYYALYPADPAASLDGTLLSISLPAVQQYAPSGFAPGFNPMVASSSDRTLSFKNLCALLMIRLSGSSTVSSISITSNKAEALWGTATVAMDYADVPALAMTAPADDAHRTITLDCSSGVELGSTPVDFHFVLPAGTLSEGFTLSVTDTQQGSMTKQTSTSVNTCRSVRSPMAPLTYIQTDSPFLNQACYGMYDLSGGTPAPVKTYDKATDQLALRTYLDSRTFRIQSLVTKSALLVSTPLDMKIGGSYFLEIESVGNTGVTNATVNVTLLKSEEGKLWLQETAGNFAFIIAGAL